MGHESEPKILTDETTHQPLTRRTLLAKAGALGLSVPVFSGLLAACGSDDEDGGNGEPTTGSADADDEEASPTTGSSTGASTTTASETEEPEPTSAAEESDATPADDEPEPTTAAEDPEPTSADISGLPQGGHVNFVTSSAGQPAHLDTQLTAAGIARLGSDPINDWLVKHDQENQIYGSLAISFEIVDDVTISFTLREGIKFHNGRTLTSEDVKQNIERVQDPANASPFAGSLAPVESVETPDETTAIFHMSLPYPVLLDILTRIPILPLEEAENENMKTNPVGAGPFRFGTWEQDSYIEYQRFDEYWDPEQPRLDSLRYNFVPDYSAGKASFQAGEQELLLTPSLVDISVFEAMESSGIHTHVWNSLGFGYLAMNHAREPYNILQVRQAIQLAIDPDAFNTVAYAGLSRPHRIPILSGTPFYFDDYEYSRDVERARELLVEAGFPDGFSDEVLIPNTSFEAPYGPLIQNQLAEIGIEMNILLMEPGPFVERTLQNKDYNICMLGDGALPDPAFLVDRYLKSDGGSNLFNYNSPEMDELLSNAGGTYDIEVRIGFYKQAMKLMVDEAVWQIVVQRATSNLHRDPLVYDPFWTPSSRYNWGLLARGS